MRSSSAIPLDPFSPLRRRFGLCCICRLSIVGWAKGGRRQGRKKNWQSLKRDHASLMLAGHQCRCRSAPCTTLDNGLSNAPRFEAVSVLGCLSPSVPYTSVLFLTCRAAPLARNPLDRLMHMAILPGAIHLPASLLL